VNVHHPCFPGCHRTPVAPPPSLSSCRPAPDSPPPACPTTPSSQVVVDAFDPGILVSGCATRVFDFATVSEAELHNIDIPLELTVGTPTTVHGVASWFDVLFNGSAAQRWLSTAPGLPTTHWCGGPRRAPGAGPGSGGASGATAPLPTAPPPPPPSLPLRAGPARRRSGTQTYCACLGLGFAPFPLAPSLWPNPTPQVPAALRAGAATRRADAQHCAVRLDAAGGPRAPVLHSDPPPHGPTAAAGGTAAAGAAPQRAPRCRLVPARSECLGPAAAHRQCLLLPPGRLFCHIRLSPRRPPAIDQRCALPRGSPHALELTPATPHSRLHTPISQSSGQYDLKEPFYRQLTSWYTQQQHQQQLHQPLQVMVHDGGHPHHQQQHQHEASNGGQHVYAPQQAQ
jgi:hypothetical protein